MFCSNKFKKRCKRCNSLFPYFREYKKRLSLSTKKYVGTTLTPTRHKIIKRIIKIRKMLRNQTKGNFNLN